MVSLGVNNVRDLSVLPNLGLYPRLGGFKKGRFVGNSWLAVQGRRHHRVLRFLYSQLLFGMKYKKLTNDTKSDHGPL